MDHYAPTFDPTPEALLRPWRRATFVVTGIAAVELLALAGIGIVLLGKGWFQDEHAKAVRDATARPAVATPVRPARHTAPAVRHPFAARATLTRAKTHVLVLNGNGRAGAAAAEASVLHGHGYPAPSVGNARRSDYPRSIVIYRPGYRPEALRLARDLRIWIVTPLDGLRARQLKKNLLAIVVGR